ncbi:MAG: type II CAAX prenyl endopeptidase Rce1 family protein [Niabella sp.]
MQLQIKQKAIVQTFILVIFNLVVLALQTWIENTVGIKSVETESRKWIEDNPDSFIFFVIVFAPICEEFAFRYFLRREKYVGAILLLSTAFFLVSIEQISLIWITVFLNILYAYFLLVKKYETLPTWLIIYSIIVFSAIHYGNFQKEKINELHLIEMLFQFVPFVLLGVNLTYIRLKYGFVYCLIGHSLYNAMLVSLHYLSTNF